MLTSQENTCARVIFLFMFSCEFCETSNNNFTEWNRTPPGARNRSISSYQRRSIKKAVLKNLTIFTGKHLCWSLFLINFIKKRLQDRYFAENIVTYYEEHLRTKVGKVSYSTKVRRSHWYIFWKVVVWKLRSQYCIKCYYGGSRG